ncbi:cytochrome P450 [Daedaleopsis nitida]|nr:cytochrome P450 [Daedaleopsis nitida]
MSTLALVLALGLACLLALIKVVSYPAKPKIPSGLRSLLGPKGYPILGSVTDIPERNIHLRFYEWAQQYGPIYQVNLAGTNHVWISKESIAHDLLTKRSAIYSDRPHLPALLHDNPAWMRQRKIGTHMLRQSKLSAYHHYPELESIRLLKELLADPTQYADALESFNARVTARLAWGRSEASGELKQRARELLICISPTGHIANKLPFLMSLPDWLSPPKAWERKRQRTESRWFAHMQDEVRADISSGQPPSNPCWTQYLFGTSPTGGKRELSSELEGAYVVGMHSIAGALLAAAVVQSFCLAMCHYPQYLPLLHEELDRVCGERLPRTEDRPDLPVLRAFVREVVRWRPPVPTGIPHLLRQDDEYDGYHIPAGSVMHPLEWGIARDLDIYPDPEAFNPLRWLEPEYPTYREPLSVYPNLTNISQFGFGPRVCTGRELAEEAMLTGIAALAWLFDIKKTANEEMNEGETDEEVPKGQSTATHGEAVGKNSAIEENWRTDPTHNYSSLMIARPLPFEFDLTVRVGKDSRAALVQQLFTQRESEGQFPPDKSYWTGEQGEYGWVKV